MKKALGAICMIVGALLLIGALALLIWNTAQSNRAEQASKEIISQLKDAIPDGDNHHIDESDTAKTNHTTDIEVNGYDYIGYLFVPSQKLNLPVMSQWDYQRLKVAPCRYSGSIDEGNLVIIAHNYSSHFGNLDQLQLDDEVLFTDTKGVVTNYQVACVDVVPPTSAKEVTAGDFDLALVTCTYGGKTRFVVYCNENM